MNQTKIARINELARKSKTAEGLTAAEKEEQKLLRQEYIQAIRSNVRAQLDNIDMVEKDGSIHDPYRIDYLKRHVVEMKKAIENGDLPTPIQFVVEMGWTTVMLGSIVSVPLALLARIGGKKDVE